MELREQVARRLHAAAYQCPPENEEEWWGLLPEDDVQHWLRAADECIRLMEWARREHALVGADAVLDTAAARKPLTLPPDSWRPDGRE